MDTILPEKIGQILKLTLNRPEKKNALTPQMYSDLTARLNEAKADFDIRVVVITGSGTAFTGGNDIFDFANTPPT